MFALPQILIRVHFKDFSLYLDSPKPVMIYKMPYLSLPTAKKTEVFFNLRALQAVSYES